MSLGPQCGPPGKTNVPILKWHVSADPDSQGKWTSQKVILAPLQSRVLTGTEPFNLFLEGEVTSRLICFDTKTLDVASKAAIKLLAYSYYQVMSKAVCLPQPQTPPWSQVGRRKSLYSIHFWVISNRPTTFWHNCIKISLHQTEAVKCPSILMFGVLFRHMGTFLKHVVVCALKFTCMVSLCPFHSISYISSSECIARPPTCWT